MDRGRPDATSSGDGGRKEGEEPCSNACTNPNMRVHLAGACSKMNQHHEHQPWQHGARFNGVPSPIASPVQDQVGPQSAQPDAEGRHQQSRTGDLKHTICEQVCVVGVG